jgi:hypothetical protein
MSMSAAAVFDEMEIRALAEPNRIVTLLDTECHPE